MKLSYSWLTRYVPDLPTDFVSIENKLTSLGFEVEDIENQGEVFDKIIVAKVVESWQHPDADSLTVNKVFDGQNEIQVVCGGSNVKTGITVAFAPVKTVLPLADGSTLKLKKAKIRGQESLGMICSTSEIGLGECVGKEIMVLPEDLEAGAFLKDLGYYDTVLEIDVTPNRPDALCHLGAAREIAAGLGLAFQEPKYSLQESAKPVAGAISVRIDAPEACTKYTARVIEGIKIAPSPKWLETYLNTIGVRPINNVVDITNFILMEMGQPLHAFDLGKLKSKEVVVRYAKEGETLVTLDEQERSLLTSDLLICDGETPACLAGVMGGQSTEVDQNTTTVLLETAYFNPPVVRKQSRRLGLMSDSSYRFERGVNPLNTEDVSAYAASLIAEVCGGEVLSGAAVAQTEHHKTEASEVSLRPSRLKSLLGMDVPSIRIQELLASIELKFISEEENLLTFSIPGFRPDLEREVDLIEEVARLIGYDEIPVQIPKLSLTSNILNKKERVSRIIRHTLAASGLNEGMSLRFNSQKDIEKVFAEGDSRRKAVVLQNPISEEWGVLPTSLIPRLLYSVSFNFRNQEKQVRLFEISRTYAEALELRSDRHPGILEKDIVSGVIAGDWDYRGYGESASQASLLDFKTILEGVFAKLNLNVSLVRSNEESFLHPLQQLSIFLGEQRLGFIGAVHPQTAKAFDLKSGAIVFEMDLEPLVQEGLQQAKFKRFSKFGEMVREINVIVKEDFDQALMLEKVKAYKVKNLVDVRLSSSYQGKGVPEGKKSLLYQFVYQNETQTLTDAVVNKAQDKMAAKLGEDSEIAYR